MKLFSNRRAKRSTALAVLLVWLFAVASGVANACLLEPPGAHSHSAKAEHHAAAHAIAAADEHDDDGDASKESCLKTCDDGSKAPVKAQTSFDLTDPGNAPLVSFAWTAATPVATTFGRFDDRQVPILGPPLRLRYSRLTL